LLFYNSFELRPLLLSLSTFVSIKTKKQMSRKINQRKKQISPVWHINTTSNVEIIQSSFEISPRQNLIPLQFYLLAYFWHTWEQALPLMASLNNVSNQSQTMKYKYVSEFCSIVYLIVIYHWLRLMFMNLEGGMWGCGWVESE